MKLRHLILELISKTSHRLDRDPSRGTTLWAPMPPVTYVNTLLGTSHPRLVPRTSRGPVSVRFLRWALVAAMLCGLRWWKQEFGNPVGRPL